jgi:diguanylate cyclase (GGDEF)-like protein/PAS domain S-box-containing protein
MLDLIVRKLRRLLGRMSPNRSSAADNTSADGSTDFRLLAESSADMICRVGPDMRFKYVSPAALRVFGRTPAEMLGHGPESFVVPEDLPIVIAAMDIRTRETTGDFNAGTARIHRPDGTVRWIEATGNQLRDPATDLLGDTIIVLRDVSDRKELEQRLASLALTDGLTGLANRRAFDDGLELEWRRTQRAGAPMSLLLLDLDDFKAFNDNFGHQAGDDCLRAVAAVVRATIRRPADVAARYGGEEMAVILPNTDLTGATAMAEKICAAIAGLNLPHPRNPAGGHYITASIGAATALSCGGGTLTMPSALLMAADTALYKAKNGGRNRVATALLLRPDKRAESPAATAATTERLSIGVEH